MTTLPDPPTGLRPFRVISGAVSVAVVFAVTEVLLRYFHAERPFDATQLTLAAVSNVALLGIAGLAAVVVGASLGWLAGLPIKQYRRHLQAILIVGIAGTLAGLLTLHTQAWGISEIWEHTLVVPVASVAMAALVGASVWLLGLSMRPSLMNLTRACVVGAWVCCTAATVLAVGRTNDYVERWAAAASSPTDHVATGAESDRPNLLLIVLDTLRADRVGVYGDSKLTPHLDEFAKSAVVFEKAVSTAPWTLPAHASMLTGLYPDEHGVNWGHYAMGDRAAVLPELLKERGYHSFAISNNQLLNEANGFARGFEAFLETTHDPTISPWKLALRCGGASWLVPWFGLSSDAGWDQGSAWTNWLLERRFARTRAASGPFFALVNYFEPHDPYHPPRRFLDRMLNKADRAAAGMLHQSDEHLASHACGRPDVFTMSEVELLAKLYDAEVAYQDEAFGRLMQTLTERGRLEDTWIVVTSDHGELFGEWEMVYHTASAHFQLLHVPLLVRPPGGTQMRRVSAPVQPVDLFVTFLAQAGAEIPSSVTRAYPLPLEEHEVPQRKICVSQTHGASIAGLSITQRRNMQTDVSKWLRWIDSVYFDDLLLEVDSQGGRALYDVSHDPGMANNLAGARTDLVEALMSGLESWRGERVAQEERIHHDTVRQASIHDR